MKHLGIYFKILIVSVLFLTSCHKESLTTLKGCWLAVSENHPNNSIWQGEWNVTDESISLNATVNSYSIEDTIIIINDSIEGVISKMTKNEVCVVLGSDANIDTILLYRGGLGVTKGLFTINSKGDQVRFSKGNLQYIGSAETPYWKFADSQNDVIGNANNSNEETANRDLFGWGTSGYNHGAINYQPWSTSEDWNNYNPYESSSCNLNDNSGQADWGYNKILNGGDEEHRWSTLTAQEWDYILHGRNMSNSEKSYIISSTNNDSIMFLTLIPDDFKGNRYDEAHGCVLLPATGRRIGDTVYDFGSYGAYWTSSGYGDCCAYELKFDNVSITTSYNSSRAYGQAVRLVRRL